MLDTYTKNMLFNNIINEYSDREQLDIIEYLTLSLMDLQVGFCGYKENSIEELYYKGLLKVLADIKDLKDKERKFHESD